MFQTRILFACANRGERDQLAVMLADSRATLDFAEDQGETRTKVRALRPDVLVLGRLESGNAETAVARPGATALEICRELKSNSRTARIMILMIVDADEVDLEQAVRAGADDLLSRPVTRRELLPRVDALLALKDVRDRRDPL
jgi:two-component system, sensor histidine kinase and response regulator